MSDAENDEYENVQTPLVVNVGDTVCDCRYLHQQVVEVQGDDVILSDGYSCSIKHCLDSVDHEWSHPKSARKLAADEEVSGNQDVSNR